jgi:hypothetical protein
MRGMLWPVFNHFDESRLRLHTDKKGLLSPAPRGRGFSWMTGPEPKLCLPQLNVAPAISAIIPSHVGGRHIPDTAYTACVRRSNSSVMSSTGAPMAMVVGSPNRGFHELRDDRAFRIKWVNVIGFAN